jgi:hypothetical protein
MIVKYSFKNFFPVSKPVVNISAPEVSVVVDDVVVDDVVVGDVVVDDVVDVFSRRIRFAHFSLYFISLSICDIYV